MRERFYGSSGTRDWGRLFGGQSACDRGASSAVRDRAMRDRCMVAIALHS